MKKFYRILLFILISSPALAQTKVLLPRHVYTQMKASGSLKPGVNYVILNDESPADPAETKKVISPDHNWPKSPTSTSCNCNVPVDASFSVAEFSGYTPPDYRNDDGSTLAKTLPFTFCFYDTTYNEVYINNNGNISFGNSIFSFSAGGFPAGSSSSSGNDTIMIAPFWGDVDTNPFASGLVYYKITPTYMIVKWDHVGYYSSHTDKLNDFQLIISDGTDPILPNGNNVAFCYGDMQWTTGDASSGTGGFGGTAANVGINSGDGVSFFQLGRFDQAGSTYDGPYLNNDGVDYLDNKSFYFSTCAPGNNIPPVLSPYIGICDSFKICDVTDTLVYLLSFSSPEVGQTVANITASAPTLGAGFTVLDTTIGQTGTILFRIVANPGLVGNHIVTITATDDGTPAASTVVTYNVPILLSGSPPDPVITASPSVICSGSGSSTLSLANASDYDGYFWSNGVSGGPITINDGNVYYVTVNDNGCYKSTADSLNLQPAPTPLILGSLAICGGATTTLYADSASLYTSISWSGGSTNDSVNVPAGTYTVTVTDPNGCTATSPPVTVVSSALNITGATTFCQGDSTLLTANANPAAGASYLWSTSETTSSIYVYASGSYYVTVSYSNGCMLNDTMTVFAIPVGVPTTAFSMVSPVCKLGANPTAIVPPTFTPGGTFSSTPGLSINPTSGVVNLSASTPGTYTVTYTVPASSCNPFGSSSTTITINPPATPVLDFSYTPVCIDGINPIPLLDAGFTSGGIFTSLPGATVVDSTGEIILPASSFGNHTITYTLDADTTLATCRSGGTSTANAVLNPLPMIGLTSDQIIWVGNSTSIIASGGVSYTWSPANDLSCTLCDTTVASPPETREYCVMVVDTNGCIDSSCTRVSVEIPCMSNRNLEAPNAFTPNGDGYNDELCLYGWNDCVDKFQIMIFDRWGEKVFESTDPDFCWNGVYKGMLLDPGVFVYFIKATYLVSGDTPVSDKSSIQISKKGNISLVR